MATKTELLTNSMIAALATDAAAHGDTSLETTCRKAVNGNQNAQLEVASCLTSARAMDDGPEPLVPVVVA